MRPPLDESQRHRREPRLPEAPPGTPARQTARPAGTPDRVERPAWDAVRRGSGCRDVRLRPRDLRREAGAWRGDSTSTRDRPRRCNTQPRTSQRRAGRARHAIPRSARPPAVGPRTRRRPARPSPPRRSGSRWRSGHQPPGPRARARGGHRTRRPVRGGHAGTRGPRHRERVGSRPGRTARAGMRRGSSSGRTPPPQRTDRRGQLPVPGAVVSVRSIESI